MVENEVSPARRHIELVECASATGFLKGGKIIATVRDRIKRVATTIQPDDRSRVSRAAFKQGLVDSACSRTTITIGEPAANKIDDAENICPMLTRISDRQHATARLAADENRRL